MINLAGNQDCDVQIKEELKLAGIPTIDLIGRMNSEVPSRIIGGLNGFTFQRAWYYWTVKGYMPLEYANFLYDNYKHLSIRVAGHDENEKPIEWVTSKEYDEKVNNYAEQLGKKLITLKEYVNICENLDKGENLCVSSYHIDTQEGLNKFAETIKFYNIIG